MIYKIIFIAILILQIITYFYLHKLNSCICAQSLNVTKEANIKYLEYIFLFFIIISISNVLVIFGIKSPSSMFIKYIMIYTMLLLFVHIILINQTYRLYRNMPNNCECAIQWPRYYLYLTTFAASVNVIMFIVNFAFGFYKGLSKGLSKSKK